MVQATRAFNLDTLFRKKIEKLRKKAKDVRIHNRLSALLWLADGQTTEQIAGLLGMCQRTVKNWLQLHLKGGLDALCSLEYKGDPG
jgi:DNA-binding NarL/FixJ family response regulator